MEIFVRSDKCAEILGKFCETKMPSIPKTPNPNGAESPREKSWHLKSTVCVARHGDRTPKCQCSLSLSPFCTDGRGAGKLKFNFKGTDAWAAPFVKLLQGRTNEIILRDPDQLQYIADAAEEALEIEGSDTETLEQLKKIIEKKKSTNGTKAQLKPAFSEEGVCTKVAVVVKWGGEVSFIRRLKGLEC